VNVEAAESCSFSAVDWGTNLSTQLQIGGAVNFAYAARANRREVSFGPSLRRRREGAEIL